MKILDKIREKTISPSSFSPITLAFLGDSVTHGCFELIDYGEGRVDCVYDQENVYHNLLRKKINTVFPNCPATIINAGISGDTATGGAERVQRDIIAYQPDIAVVCYGLNDVHQRDIEVYKKSLESIFVQLKNAGIETVFMTPNMMCTRDGMEQITVEWIVNTAKQCSELQKENGLMDRYMDAAREVSKKENVILCDCYSDWKKLHYNGADVTCLLSNFINHPTRKMHELFAERLFECIFLNQA